MASSKMGDARGDQRTQLDDWGQEKMHPDPDLITSVQRTGVISKQLQF